MSTDFRASYDRTTKVLTGVSCAVLVMVALVTRQPWVLALSAAIIGVSYAYSPRGYSVGDGEIVVKRLVGPVRLALRDIREIRKATSEDLRGCLRLFGSGGMFGYYGLFRTSKLGRAWWYVTDRSRAIVVVTGAGVRVLSPDDGDGFLAACGQFATVTAPEYGEGAGGGSVWRSPAAWIGIGIGVASLGLVAAALVYAPGPPRWTLTGDRLMVHDRFYPVTVRAGEVDVDHLEVIDIKTSKDWRPTMRTNGFANSHYRSGWFRTANGQSVRMYRAEGTRLALLPARGSGNAILMEVADPEGFVEQVRREWGRGR